MGRPKPELDRGGVSLLAYVVSVARESIGDGPVVVAAAPAQRLPTLPEGVELARDAVAGRGPLQGLLAGLEALEADAEVALVLATDLPLVRPELGRALLALLEDGVDAVVPIAHGHRHPLAAVYRTTLLPVVAAVLADGTTKAGILLERCTVRLADAALLLSDPALAAADPELDSLVNVNTPDELAAARERWHRPAGKRSS